MIAFEYIACSGGFRKFVALSGDMARGNIAPLLTFQQINISFMHPSLICYAHNLKGASGFVFLKSTWIA